MGQTTYIPEGADKAYNVKKLLGAIGETNEELRILKKLEGNLQDEKEPPKTDTLLLQPNIFGIGINFNQLFKFEFIKSWNKSWKSFLAKLKSLKKNKS